MFDTNAIATKTVTIVQTGRLNGPLFVSRVDDGQGVFPPHVDMETKLGESLGQVDAEKAREIADSFMVLADLLDEMDEDEDFDAPEANPILDEEADDAPFDVHEFVRTHFPGSVVMAGPEYGSEY